MTGDFTRDVNDREDGRLQVPPLGAERTARDLIDEIQRFLDKYSGWAGGYADAFRSHRERLTKAEALLRAWYEASVSQRFDAEINYVSCNYCGGRGVGAYDCEHIPECEAGSVRAFLEGGAS